jgi:hypothetical protein
MFATPLIKRLTLFLLLLSLPTLACGLTVDIPVDNITTGPTQMEEINIPAPNTQQANLTLSFGAGKFKLNPGAQGALVSGTVTYNVEDMKPKVSVDGAKVNVETGDLKIEGFPNFSNEIKNEWDFELGAMPMDLHISAGAYDGEFDLGGLSIRSLEITDGASNVRLKFSQPNQVEMDTLRYQTGASNVSLSGLANANFSSMIFRSGAGNYTLDFSGALQRDAAVTVESGISHVVIIVPQGVSAKVIFDGGMSSVSTSGDWQKSNGMYLLSGNGPTLTINVDLGAGSLELRTH